MRISAFENQVIGGGHFVFNTELVEKAVAKSDVAS
jgi:hypothetical protein